MTRASLVVPCYNEAERLDVKEFRRFARSGAAHLILVNDGSRDNTAGVLHSIAASAPDTVTVIDLPQNGGKAEAVRRGMLEGVLSGSKYIGFWDADLATPFDAFAEFVARLDAVPHLDVVMGSRVRLLGRSIDRHASRHYAGRVFATAASLTLRLPVYDTQCGAKLFRSTDRLAHALEKRFLSKWVFDVELLARIGSSDGRYEPDHLLNAVYEFPLIEWKDVAGSKLRSTDFAKSGLDLLRIYRAYIWGRTRRVAKVAPEVHLSKAAVVAAPRD